MPVYAQIADLVSRFGEREIVQLTDRAAPPTGAIDPAIANRALADADAEIDSYLAAQYDLPLAQVPALLARLACDIARYRLWDDQAPAEVRDRYRDAVRMLEAIAAGRATLGVVADGEAVAGVRYASPGRVMQDLGY